MSDLLIHPALPIRYIYVHRIPGSADLWQASFPGDQWTSPFRTTHGKIWLVRDAVLQRHLRCGLPIVEEDISSYFAKRQSVQAK